jgi:peptidoglycan/LPS O-acetylase OafA/YrhL
MRNSETGSNIQLSKKLSYIPELDALRALAVVMVLCCHFSNISGIKWNLEYGNKGVDIFFSLSGFLITSILLKTKENKLISSKQKIYKFWIRRALRLFPLYFIFLLFFNICTNVFHLKLLWRNEYNIWFFTYTPNIYMYLHGVKNIYPFIHLWSLGIEEQFYLFWPFIVLFLSPKWIIRVLLAMIGFSLFLSIRGYSSYDFLPFSKFHILGSGAILAYALHYKNDSALLKYIIKFRQLLFLISFCMLSAILFFESTHPLLYFYEQIFLSVGTLLILVLTLYGWGPIPQYFFRSKPIQYIGKISYGLYLLHLPVPLLLLVVENKTGVHINNPVILFCFYFLISFILASISYKYFESYFLKLKDRFE